MILQTKEVYQVTPLQLYSLTERLKLPEPTCGTSDILVLHACRCTFIDTRTKMHAHACMHAYTCIHTHSHTHKLRDKHTYKHTHIHTHAHHAYNYICMYKYVVGGGGGRGGRFYNDLLESVIKIWLSSYVSLCITGMSWYLVAVLKHITKTCDYSYVYDNVFVVCVHFVWAQIVVMSRRTWVIYWTSSLGPSICRWVVDQALAGEFWTKHSQVGCGLFALYSGVPLAAKQW